jgi:hypothetical protein
VPFLLELKIRQMHFLKAQKKAKNAFKKTPKNRDLKPAKSLEKSLKQRVKRRFFFAKNTNEKANTTNLFSSSPPTPPTPNPSQIHLKAASQKGTRIAKKQVNQGSQRRCFFAKNTNEDEATTRNMNSPGHK